MIGGAREGQRRRHSGQADPAGERDRIPVAGGIGVDPLTHWGTAVGPRHRRVGPAFVHEDQPVRVHAGQGLTECLPSLLDLRADPARWRAGPSSCAATPACPGRDDGHDAASDAEALAQFLERRIGLLADQLAEPLQVLRSQRRRMSAAVGLGLDRAGTAVGLQQADDEREAHDEAASDLAQRALTSLDGVQDALSEIVGIGGHGSPPHGDLRSNRMPSHRSALVTRQRPKGSRICSRRGGRGGQCGVRAGAVRVGGPGPGRVPGGLAAGLRPGGPPSRPCVWPIPTRGFGELPRRPLPAPGRTPCESGRAEAVVTCTRVGCLRRRFDTRTGACLEHSRVRLRTYEVRVEAGSVFIALGGPGRSREASDSYPFTGRK